MSGKKEFVEFLFKRIKSKTNDLGAISDGDEVAYKAVEDLEEYVEALKIVVTELFIP